VSWCLCGKKTGSKQPPRHKDTKKKMGFEKLSKKEEAIAKKIVDAAYIVHKNLGPGLLEKIYETCFCHELKKKGLKHERQVDIPIVYDGITFDEGLRLDVLVENLIICELKAVDEINPVWQAQVMSHLKLTGKRLGFLINFNVPVIRKGIKRIIL
jgi:GxxExxY protein